MVKIYIVVKEQLAAHPYLQKVVTWDNAAMICKL